MRAHCEVWDTTTANSHMESDFEAAYLLHSRPYRDSSLIIECFSREQGRRGIVARSVKGSSKRSRELAAALQPFRPLDIRWRGQGELKTLVEVETRQAVGLTVGLKGNALFCALYLNEITLRALHRLAPHPQLWLQYESALTALSRGAGDISQLEVILRNYELNLLAEMGYGLDFTQDVASGQAIVESACYALSDEGGFYQVPAGPSVFRGCDLLALSQSLIEPEAWSESMRRELKRICRQALVPLVGAAPLKSRSLFKSAD